MFPPAAVANTIVVALLQNIADVLPPPRREERAMVTVGGLALPLAAVEATMPETRIPPVLLDQYHPEATTGTLIRATMMGQELQGPGHRW